MVLWWLSDFISSEQESSFQYSHAVRFLGRLDFVMCAFHVEEVQEI
jgi:hypothetical protein